MDKRDKTTKLSIMCFPILEDIGGRGIVPNKVIAW